MTGVGCRGLGSLMWWRGEESKGIGYLHLIHDPADIHTLVREEKFAKVLGWGK